MGIILIQLLHYRSRSISLHIKIQIHPNSNSTHAILSSPHDTTTTPHIEEGKRKNQAESSVPSSDPK